MIRTKLSVLMAEQDIRQDELSARTGISKATLSNVANNKTSGIQYEILDKLALFFNVSPSDFFEYIPYNIKITGSKNVVVDRKAHLTSFKSLTLHIISKNLSDRPLPFEFGISNPNVKGMLTEIDFIDPKFDHFGTFNPDDDELFEEFLSALSPALFRQFSAKIDSAIHKYLYDDLVKNNYTGKFLISLGGYYEPEHQFIIEI